MLWCMRTTLTLDNDIAVIIQRLRQAGHQSLKEIVNEALREGLKHLETKPMPAAPFRTETVSAGRCRIGDLADVAEALAIAEGDDFK